MRHLDPIRLMALSLGEPMTPADASHLALCTRCAAALAQEQTLTDHLNQTLGMPWETPEVPADFVTTTRARFEQAWRDQQRRFLTWVIAIGGLSALVLLTGVALAVALHWRVLLGGMALGLGRLAMWSHMVGVLMTQVPLVSTMMLAASSTTVLLAAYGIARLVRLGEQANAPGVAMEAA